VGPSSFRGQQNPDVHGSQLTWPGIDGFPVIGEHRGPVPDNENDYDLIAKFGAAEFVMNDPASRARFIEIMNYVYCGWFKIVKRHDRYDEAKKGWIFWIEWIGVYAQITKPRM
jgi:hypothetical protein